MINCIFLPEGHFYYSTEGQHLGILIENTGDVNAIPVAAALATARENQSVEHFNRAENWEDSDNLPNGVNEFFWTIKQFAKNLS